MPIIALHGAKGSGKDTFFRLAKDNRPNTTVKRVAFAGPISEFVKHVFGLPSDWAYDQFKRQLQTLTLGDNTFVTQGGRHIVREIGMKMRSYDPEQFNRYVKETIDADPSAFWCITDLRFEDELHFVRSLGGYVVKIKRVGVEYDNHITETEFPDHVCDFVINNTSNQFEQYKSDVLTVFDTIMKAN